MKILHLNSNKKWVPVEKRYYNDEAHLQDLLAEDIDVLPFDEIGYETPFVAIGKEVGLANGSLDLLAISPLGQIALIETKLDKNPEVKRTVVGQILGYASYLWNKSYDDLEVYFKKFLAQRKIKFDGSLFDYICEQLPDYKISEIEFREGIEKRLRLGSFTLLIVVDQANQELKDIANYLNDRTGQEIDFYLAEMELIGDDSELFLVPRLSNPPRKNISSAKTSSNDNYDRSPMSKDEFMASLSPSGHRLAVTLLEESEVSQDIITTWRKNGFSLMTKIPKELVKPGALTNFSYLYFKAGNGSDKNKEELQFGYSEWALDNMSEIMPTVKEYVEYYRTLPDFDEKRKVIKDLAIFTDEKAKEFIELVKKTARLLSNA